MLNSSHYRFTLIFLSYLVEIFSLFSCKKCNIFYWDMAVMKKHTCGLHTNQEIRLGLLCEICGKNFTNQSQLWNHRRLHVPIEQRRSFECYICKLNFAYKKSLTHHMTMHSGIKIQFDCDVCQSTFSRSDALQRHSLIHLNKLPHTCQYCAKGFRTKFNLKVMNLDQNLYEQMLW